MPRQPFSRPKYWACRCAMALIRTKLKRRRKRDSNPRAPCSANGFQDRRFQPLTHSSEFQGTESVTAGAINGLEFDADTSFFSVCSSGNICRNPQFLPPRRSLLGSPLSSVQRSDKVSVTQGYFADVTGHRRQLWKSTKCFLNMEPELPSKGS